MRFRLCAACEELADIRTFDAAKASKDEYVAAAVVKRLLTGDIPLRVWREHRELTLQMLADKVGVSKAYLSEIETGKKEPSLDVAGRLADALAVDIDDIV